MEYFVAALKKFTVLSGRASRKEYWMFTLFFVIFSFVFIILDIILMNVLKTSGFLNSLFSLVMFIPSIAITIRRLHDINKSGKMILINFIPLVGPIWSLILMLRKGDAVENQYGPVPVDGVDTASVEQSTSNLESLINPNQETIPQQPVVVDTVSQQVTNQQQFVEQPPVQPMQPPVVPTPLQPIQEITTPPQEKTS